MDDQAATVLAAVVGLPDDTAGRLPDLDPPKLAQVTAGALVEWMTRLAAATPTVVLVDDVADADPSSLAVLAQLAAAPPPRLLLVFTAPSAAALPPSLGPGPTEMSWWQTPRP
jgi:hypothetical protein